MWIDIHLSFSYPPKSLHLLFFLLLCLYRPLKYLTLLCSNSFWQPHNKNNLFLAGDLSRPRSLHRGNPSPYGNPPTTHNISLGLPRQQYLLHLITSDASVHVIFILLQWYVRVLYCCKLSIIQLQPSPSCIKSDLDPSAHPFVSISLFHTNESAFSIVTVEDQ